MTAFDINSDAVKQMVAKGFVEALEPEQKNLLLQNAVDKLLVEPLIEQRYGSPVKGESIIAVAFNDVLRKSAHEAVAEMMNQPEWKATIDKAIRDTVAKYLSQDWKLDSVVTEAIIVRVKQILDGER